MTTPDDGKTPSAPDVDQPNGGAHTGPSDDGRTPSSPGIDEPETTSAPE